MIDTIYIEEAVARHPRTSQILGRFPKAVRIPCERFGEIFNRSAQNFRLQKEKPALILAEKFDHFVLEAPAGYGIGSKHNYYFSHMLNCIYDCRYCFLQGMFRSANLVCFVNYEDFEAEISEKIKKHPDAHFFSGYDCDSLAFEPVTGFANSILDLFAHHPSALIELRTKSVQVKSLLGREAMANCVVAFSFTPEAISKKLEPGVPSIEKRIEAMKQLAANGWPLGLRFDPVIYHEDYLDQYRALFETIFKSISARQVHSVSLGPFRLPKDFYERMYRLYPDEKLFAGPLEERGKIVSYGKAREEEVMAGISSLLLKHIPKSILFACV